MKIYASILVLGMLFVLTSVPSSCHGDESGFHMEGQGMPQNHVSGSSPGIDIGVRLASFFRDYISAVDGDRCPSIPTCSSYSVEAFKKHGFLMGWLMTVDRLIHEADEAAFSLLVRRNGRFSIYDPVENNDFWWLSSNDNE